MTAGPAWFKDQCMPRTYTGLQDELNRANARIAELERRLARSGVTHEQTPYIPMADSCYRGRVLHEVHRPFMPGPDVGNRPALDEDSMYIDPPADTEFPDKFGEELLD